MIFVIIGVCATLFFLIALVVLLNVYDYNQSPIIKHLISFSIASVVGFFIYTNIIACSLIFWF
jgi:hypothetical protein